MEISDRIIKKMTALELKGVDIERLVGVSSGTVSMWRSGTTSPSGKNLVTLARVLGVSESWIATGKSEDPNKPVGAAQDNIAPVHYTAAKTAPLIGYVQAGNWSEATDPYPVGSAEQWISTPEKAGQRAFWLRVTSDSMTSDSGLSIPEGHIICVDPDIEASSGNLIVAKLPETNEVTFKQLRIDCGTHYLVPLNKNYKQQPMPDDCQVIGVVLEARLQLF
jgi:SOS-response transcriptional repressor LexA